MNRYRNLALALLLLFIVTACGPKTPTLFEINDTYTASLGLDHNYSIKVVPLANEEAPTYDEIAQRADKVIYYEVYLLKSKTLGKQIVSVHLVKDKTQINADEFTVEKHRYFSVYQDITKQDVIVSPVAVDASIVMKKLCESTAETMNINKICD